MTNNEAQCAKCGSADVKSTGEGVRLFCFDCKYTVYESELQQPMKCVKCGHIKLEPWRGYCKHEISPFGKRPIRYCGCKCEFPASPVAQSARERPDAIRIVRDVEYAVGEEFPTATRRELIDRIAAALSATPSDPAEPNIEQGRVPALGLYPDESAPSVAGGEPAPLLCGPCAAGQHYRCEAERILTKVLRLHRKRQTR